MARAKAGVKEAAEAADETADSEKPTIKLPKGWVSVVSASFLVDPFEGTEFFENVVTPTKLTSWVKVQLEAKIIVKVEG